MDANGGNTARKWPRETHALVHTIDAQWQLDVQFGNKYGAHQYHSYNSMSNFEYYLAKS